VGNYLHGKNIYIKEKILLKYLFTLKNYCCIELLALKIYLDSRIGCIEELLQAFKKTKSQKI
jgi:hypothetical protein